MKKLVLGFIAFIMTVNVQAKGDDDLFYKKTFDLGLATGSVNNFNYTEADLGLNLYFNPYLDFRNAVFAKFISGAENIYGLDSSMRGVLNLDLEAVGMTTFLGTGVRFQSRGSTVPFAEGGLVFRLVGFAIGGGAKRIFNSAVNSSVSDETQYFIILSGGGSL